MMNLNFYEVPSIFGDDEGEVLRVFEKSSFTIPIERVFTVTANKGATRGSHAHKKCNQILSCVSGEVELLVDDGSNKKNIRLTTDSAAVHIPSGVWAEQIYKEEQTVLLVICDQLYDEDDYIRDYEEFTEWKKGGV